MPSVMEIENAREVVACYTNALREMRFLSRGNRRYARELQQNALDRLNELRGAKHRYLNNVRFCRQHGAMDGAWYFMGEAIKA